MSKSKIIAAALAVTVIGVCGVNYFLWHKQTKQTEADILMITEKLDKSNTVLTYDTLSHGMVKAWDVTTTLANVKLASKDKNDELSLSVSEVQIKKDPTRDFTTYYIKGDLITKHKNSLVDDEFKVSLKGDGATIVTGFDKNKEFKKFEFSDKGMITYDNKTQKELASSDSTDISISRDIVDSREKIEFLLSSKGNKFSPSFAEFDPLYGAFKDLPELGKHDHTINITFDIPHLQNAPKNMMTVMGYLGDMKVDLKEFKYSNDLFSLGLDMKFSTSNSPIPSGNLNILIGKYENFIDYAYKASKAIDKLPTDVQMPLPPKQKIEDAQIAKFKVFMSQFKINDTDIKLDFAIDPSGNTTLKGKPVTEYEKELNEIFPPLPPKGGTVPMSPPAQLPGQEAMPEQNIAPMPMDKTQAPRTPVIIDKQFEPAPAPTMPAPYENKGGAIQ